MTMQFCFLEFAFFLCISVEFAILSNGKLLSLDNKYSQRQSLRSVEMKRSPFHNIVKRDTRHPKFTAHKVTIDTSKLVGSEKSNQAFVHWIGKETSEKVIVLTCQYNMSSEMSHVVASQLWRSDDYGSTFNKVDVGPGANISYFYTFPTNSQKLLFTDVEAKKIYLTSDEATNFTMSSVPVEPDIILPHPSNENAMLLYSLSQRKLYVSMNSGQRWNLLAGEVLPKFYWGAEGFDSDVNNVHMEVEGASSDTAKYKLCIAPDCIHESNEGETLGPFDADSLLVHKEFIFLQKSNLNGRGSQLMVSYKRQPFKAALFPGNTKANDFILLDLDDQQVFVAVAHEDSVNLYLSDPTGHYFVLSFSDVYHAIHPYWLEIDFHEVKGMNWTFLVNKRDKNNPNGVQTYISFDKGGNWGAIPTSQELKKECKDEDCQLQLHINRSPIISPALSSKNAPGIIMAHGTLASAKHPDQPLSLFTSRDGGWTWTKAPFDGVHSLNILDQGSILTAMQDGFFNNVRSKYIHFSCDEGATWKEDIFDNYGFVVNGVLSEPEILTMTEMLFGHEDSKEPWILIKLNFSMVLAEKCKTDDYESWFPEDFNDVTQNNCTMGRLVEYKRRKQNAACHNGEELIPREVSNHNCECTREDYECDFGYEEAEKGKSCSKAKWYNDGYLPLDCQPGANIDKSQGYRKVSSDDCLEKEDEKKKYGPVKSKCELKKPIGLFITAHSLNVPAGKVLAFQLSQTGGSTSGTTYTWDMGDGSKPQAVKDFKTARSFKYAYAKSGHFIVTVKAENGKGQTTGSLTLHVQHRLSDLTLVTPLAGKAGINTVMEVVVSSTLQLFPQSIDHVHFLWKFGDEEAASRPLLTWEQSVNHTYQKAGVYTLSVEAVNSVGSLYRQYQINVYDEAEILELELEASVMVNISSPVIKRLLLQRLRYQLSDDLGLMLSGLEATTSPDRPKAALLYIYPSSDPSDEKIGSVKQRILDLVNGGKFGFSLLGKRAQGGVIIKVTSAKPYTPTPQPDKHKEHHHKGTNLKALFIGAPVLLIAVVSSIVLLCYCRKKHRNAQQYNMLHMQDDSDALLDDEDDPPLDLNIEFRGRDNYRDDPVLDAGGSQLVMQDTMENC